jgi:hypothetical protein
MREAAGGVERPQRVAEVEQPTESGVLGVVAYSQHHGAVERLEHLIGH